MTQETDRALLFYAAKAAGIEFNNASLIPMRVDNGMNTLWDPLTDDGDALRLAVRLKILCGYGGALTWIAQTNSGVVHRIEKCDDAYAATRRAIVRAAAEIGKAME